MVDLIFSFCEILVVGSYLFRSMLMLRVMTVFGMTGYVIGGFLAGYEMPGMKALIFFSALAVLINIYQSIQLIIEKIPVLLPNNVKDIYKNNFHMMTTSEFYKIYKFSNIKKYKEKTIVAEQNQPINELKIILTGSADVIKNNQYKTTLKHGFFIGEMSFITNGVASATVTVGDEGMECIVWDKEKLKSLERKQPDLYKKLKQAIAINLVKKLDESTL